MTTRGQFCRGVLRELGYGLAPWTAAKTYRRVTFMLAWGRGEFGEKPCDGRPDQGARYNLFATTRDVPGSTWYNTFGSGMHVRNYPDARTGERAIADTLRNGNYPDLLAAIDRADSADAMAAALAASPWGTGSNAAEALPTVRRQRGTEWGRSIG